MEDGPWNKEQMLMAQKIAIERFAMNSVAGHVAPITTVSALDTTVPRMRYMYNEALVIDRETWNLHEPFSYCIFTQAQVDEFTKMPAITPPSSMAATAGNPTSGMAPPAGNPTGRMAATAGNSTSSMAATAANVPAVLSTNGMYGMQRAGGTQWMQSTDGMHQSKVLTTINRAASNLARWHDVLFFRGLTDGLDHKLKLIPPLIELGVSPGNDYPLAMREAAMAAEAEERLVSIPVCGPQINEGLVSAVYTGVNRLEQNGYWSTYQLILGEVLWRELHRPTSGSLVLPRWIIHPVLCGGDFYRTTTLPADEALLASLDGCTFDCVMAGEAAQFPLFEWVVKTRPTGESRELYHQFRLVIRFAPRIRENRSIVRLKISPNELGS
jgi:hypothetical protein